MPASRGSGIWRTLIYVFLGLAILLIVVQIFGAWKMQSIADDAMSRAQRSARGDVELQKARQDLVAAQIGNESKNVFVTFAGEFGALTATLVTISGAILALRGYLDSREKEQQDRADAEERERTDRADARNKERQDRLATSLSETLSRLVGSEPRERVVGAAGLFPFFEPDRAEFHLQSLTALIAAARVTDEEPEVRQGVRLVIERACRAVSPELLNQVSWQGVTLPSINLAKQNLTGLDFRNANLQNANLLDAILDGSDFSAAKLQGALLENASLRDANLAYCDLAGANLTGAHLNGARLHGVKVLNAELKGADLSGASGWRGVPWDATRNWRQARFDPAVRAELDTLYGKEAPGIRVTMLMWEMPPMVAGGTWTASYHLVRNLKRRGALVTVVVPWERQTIVGTPFGSDVPIVALGIKPPEDDGVSQSGSASWSPYAGISSPYAYSPYGQPSWSPYSQPSWSPYSRVSPYAYSPYGPSRAADLYQRPGLSGSILFRLMGEFGRRVQRYMLDHPCDVIHAHDWITFDAARAAAEAGQVPWIAHFHSTEKDRQHDDSDPLTERIEQGAVDSATRIIAPSTVTSKTLISRYHANPEILDVVPNGLSEGASSTADMGRFETKRIVFLGRLTEQKGVDRFCAVADEVRKTISNVSFEAFGEGEQRGMLAEHRVRWNGPLNWDERGRAFRGASVVLVPSRAEPFGMVILEAMQHRVPVIYPANSGAAEVLESGIKVTPDAIETTMTGHVIKLIGSLETWESAVRLEAVEIDAYPGRGYEDLVIKVWSEAVAVYQSGRKYVGVRAGAGA